MNAKFKMPKFGRNLTIRGWIKELLLTFIATTISIVLTFGTAAYLEDRQTVKARRMMAMTIINDIDQSLEIIKKRKDAEEKGHEAACYVIENEDRLVKKLDQNNRTAQSITIDGIHYALQPVNATTLHFNAQGHLLPGTQKGLNIVRKGDGKTVKVITK